MILSLNELQVKVYYILSISNPYSNFKAKYIKKFDIPAILFTEDVNEADRFDLETSKQIKEILGDLNNSDYEFKMHRRVSIDFEDNNNNSLIADVLDEDARISVELMMEPPQLISSWDELRDVKSQTHGIEIDKHSGHVTAKSGTDKYGCYLSTHTFYGMTHEQSTSNLQERGFNVKIANWDAESDSAEMTRASYSSGPRILVCGDGAESEFLKSLLAFKDEVKVLHTSELSKFIVPCSITSRKGYSNDNMMSLAYSELFTQKTYNVEKIKPSRLDFKSICKKGKRR
jgi:hypothetical protein